MPGRPLTLMAVHAHPDDEAIATGGILAKYAAEGVHTVLITCTRGERGEVSDPAFVPPRSGMRLAEIRMAELAEAVRILGVGSFYCLGYMDSGMAGTPGNDDPASFARTDQQDAAHRLARLMRKTRPQVVVTYDAYGVYGHPDHIMAHRITCEAFRACGDPAVTLEGLAPWQPLKLYYFAIPQERLEKYDRTGVRRPTALKATPQEQITTCIDVSAYLEAKFAAIYAHKSQIGDNHFFRRLNGKERQEMFGREHYVCARGCRQPPPQTREDDFFTGLR